MAQWSFAKQTCAASGFSRPLVPRTCRTTSPSSQLNSNAGRAIVMFSSEFMPTVAPSVIRLRFTTISGLFLATVIGFLGGAPSCRDDRCTGNGASASELPPQVSGLPRRGITSAGSTTRADQLLAKPELALRPGCWTFCFRCSQLSGSASELYYVTGLPDTKKTLFG